MAKHTEEIVAMRRGDETGYTIRYFDESSVEAAEAEGWAAVPDNPDAKVVTGSAVRALRGDTTFWLPEMSSPVTLPPNKAEARGIARKLFEKHKPGCDFSKYHFRGGILG